MADVLFVPIQANKPSAVFTLISRPDRIWAKSLFDKKSLGIIYSFYFSKKYVAEVY